MGEDLLIERVTLSTGERKFMTAREAAREMAETYYRNVPAGERRWISRAYLAEQFRGEFAVGASFGLRWADVEYLSAAERRGRFYASEEYAD